MLGAERVSDGDVLVALESSGLHTNGYSLARRIVADRLGLTANDPFPGESGATAADVLLRVHRSYLASLRPVLPRLHALAHITGGGIPGNLNRSLPATLRATVYLSSWTVPEVFRVLQDAGRVSADEMFRAFNMGVGAIAIVDGSDEAAVVDAARAAGVRAWRIGEIVRGHGDVVLIPE